MILISCALKFEAKPLIAALKLNHVREINEYKVYSNEDIYLVITGVGKIKSATATAFIIGKIGKPDFALNIGVCGSATVDISIRTAIIANKIYDESSDRSFFSKITFSHGFKETTLHTFDKPVSHKLLDSVVVDMEGSGFFQSANKFLPEDRIFCVKVVSDHLDTEKLDTDLVESIIDEKLPLIKELFSTLDKKRSETTLSTIERLNLGKK